MLVPTLSPLVPEQELLEARACFSFILCPQSLAFRVEFSSNVAEQGRAVGTAWQSQRGRTALYLRCTWSSGIPDPPPADC